MAVFDTKENNRTWMTAETLKSLALRVDFTKHRLFVIDNGSCEETKQLLSCYSEIRPVTVITNETNIGTANAINRAWAQRMPGEHLIKMDNDVVIHQEGWVDLLEEVIARMESTETPAGIVGLKRKDCIESPNREAGDFYHSELVMTPAPLGHKWIVAEKVNHVMGTCQMYNHKLIDKIGGLYQMQGLYGFDDALAAIRCQIAGFHNYFVPEVVIDHIDPGDTGYQKWKEGYAGERMKEYNDLREQYLTGKTSIYHPL
jgi:GT2 family glycosyltransferase